MIGGAYLTVASATVGVAGGQAGQVAAAVIAGVTVGLPALVAGVWSLAHVQATGSDGRDGER